MTRRYLRLAAIAAVVALVAAACGKSTTSTTKPSSAKLQYGGTLNLGLASDVSAAFDPQKEYYGVTWEFYRCCLLRTLYSYRALPGTAGNQPVPDLATSYSVSSNGLVWTFHIRPGVHYSPPVQNETVTAQDFVRALMREANAQDSAGGYPFYYSVIKGFDAATKADGKSPDAFAPISGLKALNPTTLQVTLTSPTGDFLYRMTMDATAPIPPLPNKPSAVMGVATGHSQNYGRFLVSTGPYMFAGENKLNFSLPVSQQGSGASGYVPGRSITLVRNPSWKRSQDPIRKAYVNSIVAIIDSNTTDLYNKLQSGSLDFVWALPPSNVTQTYSTTASLKPYVHSNPDDRINYLSMNLAMPPFDDIHVRKALNYITDKTGLIRLVGGPLFGVPATHLMPNDMLNNVLASYNPYPSPGEAGDVAAAKKEMMASKYDTKHNGMCDVTSVCKNVLDVIDESSPYPQEAELLNKDFSEIGITLRIQPAQRTTMYSDCNNPAKQIPICTSPGWGKDYADPLTFMIPLFSSASIYPACCNYSLVGASASQLKGWKYSVTSVPNVDSVMNKCLPLTGQSRIACWANADKYIMQNVVPWVPWISENDVDLTSTRIAHYQYDNFGGLTALDQIALKNGGK